MRNNKQFTARFPIGDVVATGNAVRCLDASEIQQGLSRHAAGDWGDLAPEDANANELAVRQGGRIFSAYGAGDNRFWIITESDRSVTTVLLPLDY